MHDDDVIREFLIESHENLSRLDQELVELEKRPKDALLLASIFRAIHTIKGTCGFLGFSTLERITHQAETLLSQLREGQRELDRPLVSLVLETVDTIRKVLKSIEAIGAEGEEIFEEVTERLRIMTQSTGKIAPPAPASMTERREVKSSSEDAETRMVEAPPAPTAAPVARPVAQHREERNCSESAGSRKTDEDSAKSSVVDANIRVGVGLLDKLMDLVGELVLTRNQILQYNAGREDAALNATSQRLNLITTELQEGVMKTRMQPIGVVWNHLPRVVRDMGLTLGKQIRLEMDGAETELDRTIIEAIRDPLVHLVRNSCDHGIEPAEARVRAGKPAEGRLSLRAYHEGGQVNIEIADDGAGIDVARVKQKAVEHGILRPEQAAKITDREALHLIFQPGFSTAKSVTKVSGRGVGMDVVKTRIEKIGGVVDIFSRPGEGSMVRLKIPLTLAIIPGLVISSGGERFVIPQVSLVELIRLERDSPDKRIEHVHGTPVYRRGGKLLPVAYLNKILGLQSSAESAEAVNLVVLEAEDRQFGLVVDGINDTQEIVVKPLGKQLKGLTIYAGATIMGDGRVALILDVLGVGQRSGVLTESREQNHAEAESKAQAGLKRRRLLLFRAGSFERLAIPLSLVARLEEFPQSSIERAGGRQVVQYRNRILPLVPLRTVLEPDAPDLDPPADPAQVIVFSDRDFREGERSVGMVVDQILDVVEEAITVRQPTGRKGLLGSAVVGKRVADFLDLNYILRAAGEDWFEDGRRSGGKNILVAEASAFSRGLIRSGLDMAGYRVIEAANQEEVLRELEQQAVDVVVTALDFPPDGGPALLAAIRQRPAWEGIPVLALASSARQMEAGGAGRQDFEDCQVKFDREGMLESVARLASTLVAEDQMPAGAGNER